MLPEHGAVIAETDFAEKVMLLLKLRGDRREPFTKALTELSNGRVTAELVETFFGDMSD